MSENLFVILYEDGTVTSVNGTQVSNVFDMADCDSMEGVNSIYAANENNELVQISVGEFERDNDAEEYAVVYGYSPIYAGSKRVGTIHHSDH